jgi:hypothetical protein
MRAVVRAAAGLAPIAIVSGAALAEIQPVIDAAGVRRRRAVAGQHPCGDLLHQVLVI